MVKVVDFPLWRRGEYHLFDCLRGHPEERADHGGPKRSGRGIGVFGKIIQKIIVILLQSIYFTMSGNEPQEM